MHVPQLLKAKFKLIQIIMTICFIDQNALYVMDTNVRMRIKLAKSVRQMIIMYKQINSEQDAQVHCANRSIIENMHKYVTIPKGR